MDVSPAWRRDDDDDPADERPGPGRQARADPAGSERADRTCRWTAGHDHLRAAHPGLAADPAPGAGEGRGGDGDLAPGPAEGRQLEPGRLAGAGGRAPVAAAGHRGAAAARLGGRRRGEAGPAGAAGELPHERGRGQGRRGAGEEVRRPVRCVRDGCLRHRPPRPGFHPRGDPLRPGCRRWPAADGRTGCAGQGPGRAGSAAAGDRGRQQGVHQARTAHQPGRQGRPADRRRRHRQHLPGRGRPSGGQVAV